MKKRFPLHTGLLLLALAPFRAHALVCQGEDLSFKTSATRFESVETSKAQIKAALLEASSRGIETVKIAPKNDGFTLMLDGQFTSPSPMGIGSIRLLLNEVTGQGRLDWDNDDGQGLSIDVSCAL